MPACGRTIPRWSVAGQAESFQRNGRTARSSARVKRRAAIIGEGAEPGIQGAPTGCRVDSLASQPLLALVLATKLKPAGEAPANHGNVSC